MRDRRIEAAERYASLALPTEAEEVWRYSRIDDLDLDAYTPPTTAPESTGVPAEVAHVTGQAGSTAAIVVTTNGHVTHVDVDPDAASKGLVVAGIADAEGGADALGSVALSSTDAFCELNLAMGPGAVVVRVPAGQAFERPIVVLHRVTGDGIAAFPRTIVQLGADSEATVIEHVSSPDVAAFVDPIVELDVGRAARLHYLNVQELGPRVWQTAYQASRVGQESTLRSALVALGGHYARVRTDSRIVGKGGTSYLTAVYFTDGERMHDFRTLQDHASPSSTSDLLFKGAVQDHGQSVYSGLIRVRKEAVGTNAFQTNRNLVLSDGASAKSVPNLEIDTDDVRCSHASAVGPIDEDHLYYLESRGIPPQVAERLIVLGFFGETLTRMPASPLVSSIRSAVADRLGTSEPVARGQA